MAPAELNINVGAATSAQPASRPASQPASQSASPLTSQPASRRTSPNQLDRYGCGPKPPLWNPNASFDPYKTKLAIAQTVARSSKVPMGCTIAVETAYDDTVDPLPIDWWPCYATVSIRNPQARPPRWEPFYNSAWTLGERNALLDLSERLKEDVKQPDHYSRHSKKRGFHVHAHTVPEAPHKGYFCFDAPCDMGFEYKHPDSRRHHQQQNHRLFQGPRAPFGWQRPPSNLAVTQNSDDGFDQAHLPHFNALYNPFNLLAQQQDEQALQYHQALFAWHSYAPMYGSTPLSPHASVFEPASSSYQEDSSSSGSSTIIANTPKHLDVKGAAKPDPKAAKFVPRQ